VTKSGGPRRRGAPEVDAGATSPARARPQSRAPAAHVLGPAAPCCRAPPGVKLSRPGTHSLTRQGRPTATPRTGGARRRAAPAPARHMRASAAEDTAQLTRCIPSGASRAASTPRPLCLQAARRARASPASTSRACTSTRAWASSARCSRRTTLTCFAVSWRAAACFEPSRSSRMRRGGCAWSRTSDAAPALLPPAPRRRLHRHRPHALLDGGRLQAGGGAAVCAGDGPGPAGDRAQRAGCARRGAAQAGAEPGRRPVHQLRQRGHRAGERHWRRRRRRRRQLPLRMA
jgi:hypothetical protein